MRGQEQTPEQRAEMVGGRSRHLSRGLSDQAPAGTEGGRAQSRRWPATAEQRASGHLQEQAAGAPATGGAKGGRDSRVASTGPAAAVNFP
jgi:hypothetical protein